MRNDTRAFEGPAGDKAPCKSGRKGWERGAGVVSGRVPGAAEGTRGEKLGLPGGPVVRTLHFHCSGYNLHNAAKRKKNYKKLKGSLFAIFSI